MLRYTPLDVDIATSTAACALLVLSDTNYPGWEASVDAQPTHLYTVDSVLRGVAVSRGSHTVSFRFRPRSFSWA